MARGRLPPPPLTDFEAKTVLNLIQNVLSLINRMNPLFKLFEGIKIFINSSVRREGGEIIKTRFACELTRCVRAKNRFAHGIFCSYFHNFMFLKILPPLAEILKPPLLKTGIQPPSPCLYFVSFLQPTSFLRTVFIPITHAS